MSEQQSHDDFQLPAELAAFEQQLAGFAPVALRVDRDRLMFAAGRAAALAVLPDPVGRSLFAARFWPAATALMTAATIMLATMLAWQTESRPMAAKPQAEQVAHVSENVVEPTAESGWLETDRYVSVRGGWPWSARPTSGYLELRYVALTQGVGAIGGRPMATNGAPDEPAPPVTARDLLEEFLPAAGRASS